MRITTGKFRGRQLKTVKGIRPTQEKVRKAVFDILGDITGLSFLELFAGTGAVGLEALSRGASEVVLVENNPDCLASLQKNTADLETGVCNLLRIDSDAAVKSLHQHGKIFELIFLDPPYYRGAVKKTLQTLSAYDILAPNGLIIVQHFKKDDLPAQLGVLSLFRQSKYGDTLLSFYKKCAKKLFTPEPLTP